MRIVDIIWLPQVVDKLGWKIVFFIYKPSREALILSARDMDKRERRQYERK